DRACDRAPVDILRICHDAEVAALAEVRADWRLPKRHGCSAWTAGDRAAHDAFELRCTAECVVVPGRVEDVRAIARDAFDAGICDVWFGRDERRSRRAAVASDRTALQREAAGRREERRAVE